MSKYIGSKLLYDVHRTTGTVHLGWDIFWNELEEYVMELEAKNQKLTEALSKIPTEVI